MPTLHGTYYSPNSAQRSPAILELGAAGQARLRSDSIDQVWVVDKLEFSDSLGGLPCSVAFPDGGKFESPDDPAIAHWLRQHGGRRRGTWVHQLERRWKWVVASLGMVVIGIILFLRLGLPAASGWIADQVPTAVRAEAGRQAMLIVETMLGDSSRTESSRVDQIDRDFQDLAALRSIPGPRPHLEVRSGGSVGPNAFAIPDGTVILTDELIEMAPDTAAIQGVLAHELGHLYYNHAMQQVVRAASLPILVVLLTGDLGSGTSLAGTIPITLVRNGYSREAEREADRFALELMRERNLDPRTMADFFEALQKKHGDLPGWLSTHPASEERIRFFRRAAGAGTSEEGPLEDARR